MDAPTTSSAGPQPEEYGVEVLCASWNPVAAAVAEPIGLACRKWLADLTALEVEAFLKQFYRCQRS